MKTDTGGFPLNSSCEKLISCKSNRYFANALYIQAGHRQPDGLYTVQVSSTPTSFKAYLIAEGCCEYPNWTELGLDCPVDGGLHETLYDSNNPDTPWSILSNHNMTRSGWYVNIYAQLFTNRQDFQFQVLQKQTTFENGNPSANQWYGGVVVCEADSACTSSGESCVSCDDGYELDDNYHCVEIEPSCEHPYQDECGSGFEMDVEGPVSYTHLTLPTIYSV